MRAVAFTAFGGPEVLTLVDLPTPEPGPGQVRLRVRAAAVHPGDLAARAGAFGPLLPPGPTYVPGWDLAGAVDATGPGVTGLTEGQPVVAVSDWLATRAGTHAEYVVLDAAAVVPAPAGASVEEAAALPVNAQTAAQALDLLDLAAGQTLAVTGAGGAVGGYAVELGRHRGLRVVGLGSARDETFVTGRGAAFVARGDDPAGALRALLPGGADGLLDAAVLGAPALAAVRDGGAYVGVLPPALPAAERGVRVHAVGVRSDGAQLRELVGLAERGVLTSRVAGTFPLDGAAEAHRAMAGGGVRGRLLLVP
jgi:NADPH:quinone reductase-like Zn-dependent oxidoreductase